MQLNAKQVLIVVAVGSTLLVHACSRQAQPPLASTECPPLQDVVDVCVSGKPIPFSTSSRPPHMHEADGYYAPVDDLAPALGVQAEVSAEEKLVKVHGTEVRATAAGAVGVHVHEDRVYVPIREFAQAAGYKYSASAEKKTVSLTR